MKHGMTLKMINAKLNNKANKRKIDNGYDGNYKKSKIGNHALKPETMMMSYGYDPQLSEGSVKPPVFLTSTLLPITRGR